MNRIHNKKKKNLAKQHRIHLQTAAAANIANTHTNTNTQTHKYASKWTDRERLPAVHTGNGNEWQKRPPQHWLQGVWIYYGKCCIGHLSIIIMKEEEEEEVKKNRFVSKPDISEEKRFHQPTNQSTLAVLVTIVRDSKAARPNKPFVVFFFLPPQQFCVGSHAHTVSGLYIVAMQFLPRRWFILL